jgi:hypothetical protein
VSISTGGGFSKRSVGLHSIRYDSQSTCGSFIRHDGALSSLNLRLRFVPYNHYCTVRLRFDAAPPVAAFGDIMRVMVLNLPMSCGVDQFMPAAAPQPLSQQSRDMAVGDH